jgi:hypothetical protein
LLRSTIKAASVGVKKRVPHNIPEGEADQGSGYNICRDAHPFHMAQPQVLSRPSAGPLSFLSATGLSPRLMNRVARRLRRAFSIARAIGALRHNELVDSGAFPARCRCRLRCTPVQRFHHREGFRHRPA